MAVGDFNGDNKLDIVVANSNNSTVTVLLGKGDGTFQSPVENNANLFQVTSAAVGDFNQDGNLDLVLANYNSNTVSVLLGNGDGTFQPLLNYAAGSNPYSVAVGDFNGDGFPDLAVSNPYPSYIAVLLNQPTAQQQMQRILHLVGGLVAAGVLNPGQGNSLRAPIQEASQQLNAGNVTPAINELGAFINHVNAFVQAGILSLAQGESLIDAADNIINQLRGPG
jgi:hypothetical protein